MVSWDAIGPSALAVLEEEVALRGMQGAFIRAARRLAEHQVTPSRLHDWVYKQRSEQWREIKARAVATHQQGAPAAEPVEVVPVPPEEQFEARRVGQGLRDRIGQLESELRVAAREENLREYLTALIRETSPRLPPAPALWKPRQDSPVVTETLYQFISDIHGYEHVSAERTRGHNLYTAEVMGRRMGQLVARHLLISRLLRRGGWHFPELVIGLGGDNVSGTIHDLERHSDAPNIVLAVHGVAWVLAQTVRELAREYERVYVYGVGGNHGRLPDARRKQMKDPTRTWDYVIYLMLREMLRDQENVEWWFPDSWGAQVEIRGWSFLLNHGDDVKSWSGLPWYGLKRRSSQMAALEGARKNIIHYQLFGHFHSAAQIPNPAGETIINGSVIGGTEFSIDGLGESERPKQWLFGVHEDHGVTHRWPLYLEPAEQNLPAFTVNPWRELQRPGELGAIPLWKVTP